MKNHFAVHQLFPEREKRMGRTTYKTAPKAGLYTRLSVDDGITDKESNSITSQKQMLMQYAQYHGIEVAEIYVDDGWSGTNFVEVR